jgi:hypothetical protein
MKRHPGTWFVWFLSVKHHHQIDLTNRIDQISQINPIQSEREYRNRREEPTAVTGLSEHAFNTTRSFPSEDAAKIRK